MDIVVVEDSLAIRRLLVRSLTSVPGAHVVGEVASEAEAIEMIRRKTPDLVVLDLALSPGNGLNVLRNLRAEGQTCKVLVLTHQPLDVYRMQCEALGADGFHDKATDIHLIVELVRKWVSEEPASGRADPEPAPVIQLMPAMAFRDAVTALPNRTALLEKLDLAVRIARRDGHGLAVFVVALEELAHVRSKLGVQRSDDVLAQAGARLAGAFSRGDVVARLAEDGFSVVVTRVVSEDSANRIGEQIVDLMRPEFVCGQRMLPMSSGVGMALFPQNGNTPQALLSLADHRARQANRAQNMSAFLASQPAALEVEHEPMLPRLRAAIGTPAFSLAYQPQCRIDNGTLSGLEALARWTDPGRGPVSPAQFITLAEENGLIDELSSQIFEDALTEHARWKAAGLRTPTLALNVSAVQVRPALIDTWAELLQRHQVSAEDIELEFTETAVLGDGPEVSRTLRTLRDMGFSLALDDFGVGYSSMSMLQRLPISTLKIDRSFVADIDQSPRSAAIVGSMIRLAQGLQIRVIAEGVEREQQLGVLKDMGCEEIQGYLLAKPMAGQDFTHWNQRHSSSPWAHAQGRLPAKPFLNFS